MLTIYSVYTPCTWFPRIISNIVNTSVCYDLYYLYHMINFCFIYNNNASIYICKLLFLIYDCYRALN